MKQPIMSREYTWPIQTLVDIGKKEFHQEFGNYIIVNSEGWIVTARHVIDFPKEQIESMWLGRADENIRLVNFITGQNDLAFARIEPFDSFNIPFYPTFGKNDRLKRGDVLHHAGYRIPPDIDLENLPKDADGFDIYPGIFHIQETRFMEIIVNKDPHDRKLTRFGEYAVTESLMMKGKSGGSLIDRNSHIYGILSSSNEVLHQGYSISVDIIRQVFEAIGISYFSI